jgi:hypothetical protein
MKAQASVARVIHSSFYGRDATCVFETVESVDAKLCTTDNVAKFSEFENMFAIGLAVTSPKHTFFIFIFFFGTLGRMHIRSQQTTENYTWWLKRRGFTQNEGAFMKFYFHENTL